MKKLTIRIPQDRKPAGAGLYEVIRYPAGEIQVRLTPEGLRACLKKDAYEIICNPIPDIVELAQLKDALDGTGEFEFDVFKHLYLPYMPYARADRRFVKGDCHGLAAWSRLVNALGFSVVWTFDAHSVATRDLVHGLANALPTYSTIDQIRPLIKKLGREGLVLIAPDDGAWERYKFTNPHEQYGLPTVRCIKHRDAATGQLTEFGVNTEEGKDIIVAAKKGLIIDDICDGGGTFIGLAQALHELNPRLKLYLYVSHGIFSKGQTELRKHFEQIFTSEYSIQMPKQAEDCNCGRADCGRD